MIFVTSSSASHYKSLNMGSKNNKRVQITVECLQCAQLRRNVDITVCVIRNFSRYIRTGEFGYIFLYFTNNMSKEDE
jgi:hypothetical protein